MDDVQIIALAAKLQERRPSLTPYDWRVLGHIAATGAEGYPYSLLCSNREVFKTRQALDPSLMRLRLEGLIEKFFVDREVVYAYTGKSLRPEPELEQQYVL